MPENGNGKEKPNLYLLYDMYEERVDALGVYSPIYILAFKDAIVPSEISNKISKFRQEWLEATDERTLGDELPDNVKKMLNYACEFDYAIAMLHQEHDFELIDLQGKITY